MRIWPTCNKLGVQFCDNILKPLESLACFFSCQMMVGKRPTAGIGCTSDSVMNWSRLVGKNEIWPRWPRWDDWTPTLRELLNTRRCTMMYFPLEIGELNLSPVFSVVLKQSICGCHQATTTRMSLKQRKLASIGTSLGSLVRNLNIYTSIYPTLHQT